MACWAGGQRPSPVRLVGVPKTKKGKTKKKSVSDLIARFESSHGSSDPRTTRSVTPDRSARSLTPDVRPASAAAAVSLANGAKESVGGTAANSKRKQQRYKKQIGRIILWPLMRLEVN